MWELNFAVLRKTNVTTKFSPNDTKKIKKLWSQFPFLFITGYVFYNLLRDHPETKGDVLTYYLSTDDGKLLQADLHAAKRDPLKSISHCYLKVSKDGANNKITGIIVEDDWVELK